MNESICTENIIELFDTLKKEYNQNDSTFFISEYDIQGYKLGLLQRNNSQRIYTTYNYASSKDVGIVEAYDRNGYFKCFNCDLCNIIDKEGILVVDESGSANTKINKARRCVHINDTKIPMILSGSDDQYLSAQAMLTTIDHIPNHFTFTNKLILSSIFEVLRRLKDKNPNVTAYFNGKFGSSIQHSHVHVSPETSPIVKECMARFPCELKGNITFCEVDYKGIKGIFLVTNEESCETLIKFTEAFVIKHVILGVKAFIAHLFIHDGKFCVCLMACKDGTKRNCTIVKGDKTKTISIIPAISTVSLMEIDRKLTEESDLSNDFLKNDLPKCLEDFNNLQYLDYKNATPIIDGKDLDQSLDYWKKACKFMNDMKNIKNLESDNTNVESLERVVYFLETLQQNEKINALIALAKNSLSSSNVSQFVQNYVFSKLFYFLVNNLITSDANLVNSLLVSFKNNNVNGWLKTFFEKLDSLKTGSCYALRGNYIQPRLTEIISHIYKYNNSKIGKTPIANGADGFVERSVNFIPILGLRFPNGINPIASYVIKTQVIPPNNTVLQDLFDHEVAVGFELNSYRSFVPNLMMTYFSFISGNQGVIILEDIAKSITLEKWISSTNFTWNDFNEITGSVLSCVYMLKKACGFTHFDLHSQNILLIPISSCINKLNMNIEYEIESIGKKRFNLKWLPVIIDYGRTYTTKNKGKYLDINWFVELFYFFNNTRYHLHRWGKCDSNSPEMEYWFGLFSKFYNILFPSSQKDSNTLMKLSKSTERFDAFYPKEYNNFCTQKSTPTYPYAPWYVQERDFYKGTDFYNWFDMGEQNYKDVLTLVKSNNDPINVSFPKKEVDTSTMLLPDETAINRLKDWSPVEGKRPRE